MNLQQALQGKTVFFITHRRSTVRNADRIILAHQGKLDEQGTHEELMSMGGDMRLLRSPGRRLNGY